MQYFKVDWFIVVLLLVLSILDTSHAYPMKKRSSDSKEHDEEVMVVDGFEIERAHVAAAATHRHHHKHHIRHKHRRRSLSSDEDTTKTQRNKQIMLTKPYWPWP